MLIPMGIKLSYVYALGLKDLNLFINEYVVILLLFLLIVAFLSVLIYRYGVFLMRPLLKEVVMVRNLHGIFDVFLIGNIRTLFIVLAIFSIVVYLLNTEIIRIPGYNYIPYFMVSTRISVMSYAELLLGLLNTVLSTWLVVSVAYLQLRIAGRHMMDRLGGALGGAVGVFVSTGSATAVSAACALGSCSLPSIGITPLAMLLMIVLGGNELLLAKLSIVIMVVFIGIILLFLMWIHKLLVKTM